MLNGTPKLIKAARHRPNPKTQETIYRVFRVPEPLRKTMGQRRGQTVQEFIQTAVEDEFCQDWWRALANSILGQPTLRHALRSCRWMSVCWRV